MWTLPKEVGDLVAMNANRSEVFKMFFALVFANQTSAWPKKMVPREEQAAGNESQVQDCWRWLDPFRSMGPDSLQVKACPHKATLHHI